jgi:glycosyltransferase involved in cell wall biosynthesis
MMKRAVLYICYYNITEPLVQTQVVSYLRELARCGIEVHLLTFERERFSAGRKSALESELYDLGIKWYSLRYHQRPSLPATLFDIFAGTIAALRLCRKHGIRLIHARSYVPAAMGLVLKAVLGCKMLFDVRGLLADEYADAGHWSRAGLKFRLTKRMERVFFRSADSFVMLTERAKQELVDNDPALRGRGDQIQVIPCCVDVDKFALGRNNRDAYRSERGWTNRRVLAYLGKLSPWYLPEEMVRFFAAAREIDHNWFFQIFTQSDPRAMLVALERAGVEPADYDIRFAHPEDLPEILGAADATISFRKGRHSTIAVSPTKVGESLAAGVPVVANAGVGDCDRIIGDRRLGVIVRGFSDEEFRRAARELFVVITDDSTPARCQKFAEEVLSLDTVGGPRYAAVYERLLNGGPSLFASHAANTE